MRIDTPLRHPVATPLSLDRRGEIVRRYWLKGELTPLGVANWLAAARTVTATL